MNNILITSAGQRVSLVRSFQKELKLLDKSNKVFTVDAQPELSPACQISDGYKKVKAVNHVDYVKELLHYCLANEIRIIIPTIDTELLSLAQNKDLFLNAGVIPIVSNLDFIVKCRDKRLINEFFVANNIEVPTKIDKHNPQFPLFIKPYDGSLSKDIYLITDPSQLTHSLLENPKFMYMEYIDPDFHDEYTVDAYYSKNGILKCAVPRKRISVRAGEINKGVTKKNELADFIAEKLSFIEGAAGCLTMQFFLHRTSKRIIAIEINPRFGGGYPLSYRSGANYPKFIIEEYLNENPISYFDLWEENLLMLRYDDEILVKNYEE